MCAWVEMAARGGLQVSTEGITQTIRAMVLSAVVQDGHATEGLEVGTWSEALR